ncbi:MAG: class I mannose-6-phosphate isomerase, partial [Muribaculaceae bacterium]|nr:class I mannose-6-phosphate isomerase [Muribaculaceae bacterium]
MGFLRFEPYFKQVLWGGQRLRPFKGLEPDDNPIGESWEISGLEGYESVVSNGQFKGKRIDALLKEYGNDILGERLYRLFGNKFPLLIKFIDAAMDLSIQVHPDDRIAKRRHKCWGKTELWYTLDPQGDAYLYSGLLESITPEQLKQHIEQNTLSNVRAKFYPSRGDLF